MSEVSQEPPSAADHQEMPARARGPLPAASLDVIQDLARIAGQLGQVQEKLASRSDSGDEHPAAHPGSGTAEVIQSLSRIEQKLNGLADVLASTPSPIESRAEVLPLPHLEPLQQQGDAILAIVSDLDSKLERLIAAAERPAREQEFASAVVVPGNSAKTGEPGHDQKWAQVLLGDELWSNADLAADCVRLIEGFLRRDEAVCTLSANLLLFQSSPPERLPHLMKDLGEAYYRWQPKLGDRVMPFEAALSSWAVKCGEAAGVRNRIEFVRPGSRFNPQQHKATDRGVEITQALGWIVLREDGSVFQKASVAVK